MKKVLNGKTKRAMHHLMGIVKSGAFEATCRVGARTITVNREAVMVSIGHSIPAPRIVYVPVAPVATNSPPATTDQSPSAPPMDRWFEQRRGGKTPRLNS